MDVRNAANEIAILIHEVRRQGYEDEADFVNGLVYGETAHLMYMCEQIVDMKVKGEKAHRWIGWMQGCIYMRGWATLEEMKQLNKKA